MATAAAELALGYGFTFGDLHDRDGLVRLDGAYLARLEAEKPELYQRLLAARANPAALAAKDEGNLLVDLGPSVDEFLAGLFGVEAEVQALAAETHG
ncbi:MAG: hypothetical protein JNL66_26555, partial [Alphaproteobacteria bacterium]|nr:hypothetical protein [Alphaproteobacteria bacterium]